MSERRFQVSTRRTGVRRVVKVRVFDSAAELQEAAAVYGGTAIESWSKAGGATISRHGPWEDRDPRPFQATIFLARDQLTLDVIAHEATHAAAHLYSIDGYRDNARASAHLRLANEPLAYLVSDIFTAIVGQFELVPIGAVAPDGVECEPAPS